ncbi:MAG TPA: acyl-CoA dehydrogenase family protein [Mycobacteriales bacterium]|jgi:alkylation response protein AidB-like acyl-CoA dehydrogenase|nr:acyl-CoA dehydrogenase family protein [Mycobacteriales bacterium]
MDLALSPGDLAFRAAAKQWLRDNYPTAPRPNDGPAMREFDLVWQRRQWDGGWAGVSWPTEYQGRGLPLLHQLIWLEECARIGAPDIDSRFVAVNHAGPTLIANGSAEQKAFHLPKILRGEVLWCQGFSEPQAGSDLASLRTTGVIDGDDLVVSGQKLWTSFADIAEYQELLVRTDPSAPKHKGLTWVICDMGLPGITIRPIKTLDGLSHFCEVFYDDVRIPLTNVVGAVNDGWRVAMSTLSFERGTGFTHGQVQLASIVDRLVEIARQQPAYGGTGLAIDDDELAGRLAVARAEIAAVRSLTYANALRNEEAAQPGPEGSMVKLFYTELRQRLMRLAMDIVGPGSSLRGITHASWDEDYLFSYTETIAGGTSDIQRNIIGERVLGLPR